MWGVADIVREGIKTAKYAPGHTIGALLSLTNINFKFSLGVSFPSRIVY
jgi:hypothetical protein